MQLEEFERSENEADLLFAIHQIGQRKGERFIPGDRCEGVLSCDVRFASVLVLMSVSWRRGLESGRISPAPRQSRHTGAAAARGPTANAENAFDSCAAGKTR